MTVLYVYAMYIVHISLPLPHSNSPQWLEPQLSSRFMFSSHLHFNLLTNPWVQLVLSVGMWPPLGYKQLTNNHIPKGEWLSHPQQPVTDNRFSIRDGASCILQCWNFNQLDEVQVSTGKSQMLWLRNISVPEPHQTEDSAPSTSPWLSHSSCPLCRVPWV